jgi:hypothetical protein
MTLIETIKTIYNDLNDSAFAPSSVIRLQNDSDGRGDYIKEWVHPIHPKPTEEQLIVAGWVK